MLDEWRAAVTCPGHVHDTSEICLQVLDEWRAAMSEAIRQRNPNHDQFWLNEVLKPRTFLDLKAAPAGVRRSWVAEALAARRPDRELGLQHGLWLQ